VRPEAVVALRAVAAFFGAVLVVLRAVDAVLWVGVLLRAVVAFFGAGVLVLRVAGVLVAVPARAVVVLRVDGAPRAEVLVWAVVARRGGAVLWAEALLRAWAAPTGGACLGAGEVWCVVALLWEGGPFWDNSVAFAAPDENPSVSKPRTRSARVKTWISAVSCRQGGEKTLACPPPWRKKWRDRRPAHRAALGIAC